MSTAFAQLDTAHLSMRVPWHDDGWCGTVCANPSTNIACLALRTTHATRNDAGEDAVAGNAWWDLPPDELPACQRERAAFMSPRDWFLTIRHPYAKGNASHAHFLPTTVVQPAYSAPAVPFRWLLRESGATLADELGLPFRTEAEEHVDTLLGWDKPVIWVQDHDNQWSLIKSFLSAIKPEASLCFFYAMEVPLTDDPRRALVGIGRVTRVDDPREYEYSERKDVRSLVWESSIHHSIRPDFTDGFVLPYQEILALAAQDGSVDPAAAVALVPDDHRAAFSYASEHVGNDAAIAALLEAQGALERSATLLPDRSFTGQLAWIDARLSEVWSLRGPCPGLASALHAFGVERPALMLQRLAAQIGDNEDPWPVVEAVLREPERIGAAFTQHVGPTLANKWTKLPDERRSLLRLLSRFSLTHDQAARAYVTEVRDGAWGPIDDGALLANPYLVYEMDRPSMDPIPVETIDRGAFPTDIVRVNHPLPEPSHIGERVDSRRVRALVIQQLERALAGDGHTLVPRDQVVSGIREARLDPVCPVDGDLLAAIGDDLAPVVCMAATSDDAEAYQLERLAHAGESIRQTIRRRVKDAPLKVDEDWRARLDERFGPVPDDPTERAAEDRARTEKSAALETLARARVSALVGPAGTGKTEVLAELCSASAVRRGGVLLLAPTGKARVQLESKLGSHSASTSARTIAQFLVSSGRYRPETGAYGPTDGPREDGFKTVVIDESSMLTEEMLAALLDGVRGVERLIFVGDHRQLPPIGGGRPFADIVAELGSEVSSSFPRTAANYAELTTSRRFAATSGVTDDEEFTDVLLAQWFTGEEIGPGGDEIWNRIADDSAGPRLAVRSWERPEDLRALLLDVLKDELELANADDAKGFELSLGGHEFEPTGQVFFWRGAGEHADQWQILSPVRAGAHGVAGLNHFLQRHFRGATRERALSPGRKIPRPMGPEGILYGDKVINVRNATRRDYFPKDEGVLEYVANGEIGVVVGQYKTKKMPYRPWKIEVEFSSQPGVSYGFGNRDFGGEVTGSPALELAYAVTVHKAQGSEFGTTIVVIPEPCRNLSRELLYTALTRQRERIVILYQGPPTGLRKYADPTRSETASRLTNLFHAPHRVEVHQKYLEDRLIHRTRRGDAVRSKSEVIIADLLYSKGISYEYEQQLLGLDGSHRLPDFTIDDDDTGCQYIWEHLGMLHNADYQSRWERKLAWYANQEIRPRADDPVALRQLIITRDDAQGGIASNEIESIINELFD